MSNPNTLQTSHGVHDLSCRPLDEETWRRWEAKNHLRDERRAARFSKAVKWACIVTLLVVAALPLYIAPYQNALRFVITGGSAVVGIQALRAHRYAVAALFAATVLLYNPIVPTFTLAGRWQVIIVYATVALFAVSLNWLDVAGARFAVLPNRTAK